MLKLKDKSSFAEGDLRKCYIHPRHSNLCVKVQKTDALNDQNAIEKWYFSILRYRKVNYKNILPTFNGTVNTDMGEGLVYELVIDNDGERSRSIADYIKQRQLTIEQAEALIKKLSNKLVNHGMILEDKNPENILLKKVQENKFIPILVDGFGAKSLGIKFFIGAFIPFYAKYKTLKRTKQMIEKIRLELGDLPPSN